MIGSKKVSTIANYITLSRFLLIPYIVQSMMYDCWMQAFCLFGLAAITDFLDGFFARQYNSESMLGKILDPLADKTLILSSFYAFSFQNKIAMIPFGMVVFLCIKDLFLILGSGLLFMIRGTIVSPSFIAKITTTLEMLLILYLASCRVFQSPASFLFLEVSLAILVLFSVYIFFDYVIKGIACLKNA